MPSHSRKAAILLALCASLAACNHAAVKARPVHLVGAGSGSLYPFVHAAALEYHQLHPNKWVDVAETGSGAGIASLIKDKKQDFAPASRLVKSSEIADGESHGRDLRMTVVAAEALVVVVPTSSQLANITVAQLKDIFFSGGVKHWDQIEPGLAGDIHTVGIDPKVSGTGEFFIEHVGGKGAKYVAGTTVVHDTPFVAEAVAKDSQSVGFCSISVAKGSLGKLKMLRVEGQAPDEHSVLDTSYALGRKLYIVTDGPPRGETAEFLKFLLSERGQTLARSLGETPVALGGES